MTIELSDHLDPAVLAKLTFTDRPKTLKTLEETEETLLAEPVLARPKRQREVKNDLAATPHPVWVEQMLAHLEQPWQGVVYASPFSRATQGKQVEDEAAWKRLMLNFFCVVEAFPKYMGLILAKTTYGRHPQDVLARDWLIGNIHVEALHVQWYMNWMAGHGISRQTIVEYVPDSQAAALYEYLWSVAYRGSLAEAIAAINYAIEGTTGEWCRLVLPYLTSIYEGKSKALTWVKAHGRYDDAHPQEALEIVKAAVAASSDPHEGQRVELAVQRSLEFYASSLEASYQV